MTIMLNKQYRIFYLNSFYKTTFYGIWWPLYSEPENDISLNSHILTTMDEGLFDIINIEFREQP